MRIRTAGDLRRFTKLVYNRAAPAFSKHAWFGWPHHDGMSYRQGALQALSQWQDHCESLSLGVGDFFQDILREYGPDGRPGLRITPTVLYQIRAEGEWHWIGKVFEYGPTVQTPGDLRAWCRTLQDMIRLALNRPRLFRFVEAAVGPAPWPLLIAKPGLLPEGVPDREEWLDAVAGLECPSSISIRCRLPYMSLVRRVWDAARALELPGYPPMPLSVKTADVALSKLDRLIAWCDRQDSTFVRSIAEFGGIARVGGTQGGIPPTAGVLMLDAPFPTHPPTLSVAAASDADASANAHGQWGPTPGTTGTPRVCAVEGEGLEGGHGTVLVNGAQDVVKKSQYLALKVLWEAYPRRVPPVTHRQKSGLSDPGARLRELLREKGGLYRPALSPPPHGKRDGWGLLDAKPHPSADVRRS